MVLPAATWGERTGTFTNADRTVHLSEKAVEPPGAARATSRSSSTSLARMDFTDKDGGPLITWTDPESAFEAWKGCSRGRPCDYSGITYDLLRRGTGIQWPHIDEGGGSERLYATGTFNTDPDYCETFGHDLRSGAPRGERLYRSLEPRGRAFLYGVEYEPGPEPTSDDRPFLLTTGRTVYHFHTRTKTGRVPELHAAAPHVWVEVSREDADSLGLLEEDLVRIESGRGWVCAPVRVREARARGRSSSPSTTENRIEPPTS